MKIKPVNWCIVVPRIAEIEDQYYQFPIGIAYVSSSLKAAGYNVTTLNLNYKQGTMFEILQPIINNNNIDVIATGGLTAQFWKIKEIIDVAKKIKPSIITCVGGGLITSDPEIAMTALEIVDFGVIGEGEITVCELAKALESNNDFQNVDGIIYFDKNTNIWTRTSQRAEIMNLDDLPYPDYESMEFGVAIEKATTDTFAYGKGRFGFVSFGRSCPFNCTFCFHPSGTKYRKRSMASVFEEIDYLIDKFSINNIFITDELFAAKIEDVRIFCRNVKQRSLGFIIQLRVDMVSEEILRLLKEAGCLCISFGLESADDRVLESMNKHITVKQIENALKLCDKIGIRIIGNFIFGDQAETFETYQNTISWWKNHPQYPISLHLITVYPGSVLYKIACKRNIIKDRVKYIKDGCPYINVSRLSDSEYRNMALEIGMLPQGRTEYLDNISTTYVGFGKVDFNASCPRCGAINTWRNQDVFRNLSNIVCEHCDYGMNIMVVDYVKDKILQSWSALEGHKIALWAMMNVVEEMCNVIPNIIENDDVYFIDSSQIKQGLKYRNKIICSPEIIKRKNIDTVFVTITTIYGMDIIETLKTKYSSTVKNIFFAGDLVDENFSKRISL